MEPLKTSFWQTLNNQYVYLAHDDGWFNKTYYKQMDSFFTLFSEVIANKASELKTEKALLGIKKKRLYPAVPFEMVTELKRFMREGMVISLQKAYQNRSKLEIPIWIVGDFDNMDDMYEEYEKHSKQKMDAKLTFDKKMKEWQITIL